MHDIQQGIGRGHIVTEVDPDAPVRQNKHLSELDEVAIFIILSKVIVPPYSSSLFFLSSFPLHFSLFPLPLTLLPLPPLPPPLPFYLE